MHEVIVGNVGVVYHGEDEATARETFYAYTQVDSGRAADEEVSWLENGEPRATWRPHRRNENVPRLQRKGKRSKGNNS